MDANIVKDNTELEDILNKINDENKEVNNESNIEEDEQKNSIDKNNENKDTITEIYKEIKIEDEHESIKPQELIYTNHISNYFTFNLFSSDFRTRS